MRKAAGGAALCAAALVWVLLGGCETTARVKVLAYHNTPLGPLPSAGVVDLDYLRPDQWTLAEATHYPRFAAACRKELEQRGYEVRDVAQKQRGAGRLGVSFSVSQDEMVPQDPGSAVYCTRHGRTVFCESGPAESRRYWAKGLVILFSRWDPGERRWVEWHRISVLTMTPHPGLSENTANELCRIAFEDFPKTVEHRFYDSSIKEFN